MKNAETLLDLVTNRRTAALGTLHRGEAAVSMVPFALLRDGSAIVIHVSRLSSHTADMLESPRVSLMIAAAEGGADFVPQALPRATVRGDAVQLAGPDAEVARESYLLRFPDAAPILEVPGFSFFAIRPLSVRVIAGFGEASTLSPEEFTAAVLGSPAPAE